MCLAMPGTVVSVDHATLIGVVDFWGVHKPVQLLLLAEPAAVGDCVLCHLGYAMRKVPPEDVAETLEMFRSLIDGDPAALVREEA